jgi:hypothetical protein
MDDAKIDVGSLNIEKVVALLEVAKKIKIKYTDGEIGWAYALPGDLAIIGNVPSFAEHIGILDVVRLVPADGILRADEVLWYAYGSTTEVRYPKSYSEGWYKAFSAGARSLGLRAESFLEGLAAVCHGTDLVPREVFGDLGLDMSGVKFLTHVRWDREGKSAFGPGVPVYTQGVSLDLEYHGSTDVIELGRRTEDEILTIVRGLPVFPADKTDDDDACPPCVGFVEPRTRLYGNVSRMTDESYVIFPGGSRKDKDADKSRDATLAEVEAWIREKYQELEGFGGPRG